eukprot:COSAG06_NODE_35457_length_459_cov_12.219444_1_plen_123_part_10
MHIMSMCCAYISSEDTTLSIYSYYIYAQVDHIIARWIDFHLHSPAWVQVASRVLLALVAQDSRTALQYKYSAQQAGIMASSDAVLPFPSQSADQALPSWHLTARVHGVRLSAPTASAHSLLPP